MSKIIHHLIIVAFLASHVTMFGQRNMYLSSDTSKAKVSKEDVIGMIGGNNADEIRALLDDDVLSDIINVINNRDIKTLVDAAQTKDTKALMDKIGWEKYKLIRNAIENKDPVAILSLFTNFDSKEFNKIIESGNVEAVQSFLSQNTGSTKINDIKDLDKIIEGSSTGSSSGSDNSGGGGKVSKVWDPMYQGAHIIWHKAEYKMFEKYKKKEDAIFFKHAVQKVFTNEIKKEEGKLFNRLQNISIPLDLFESDILTIKTLIDDITDIMHVTHDFYKKNKAVSPETAEIAAQTQKETLIRTGRTLYQAYKAMTVDHTSLRDNKSRDEILNHAIKELRKIKVEVAKQDYVLRVAYLHDEIFKTQDAQNSEMPIRLTSE